MSKVDIFAVVIVFSRKLFSQVLDQTAPAADSVNLSDHGRGRSCHEIDCVLPRETSWNSRRPSLLIGIAG